MAGLRSGKTLFEAVPALGAISAQGGGAAKLMPDGFDHPGLELIQGVNRIGRDPAQNQHVVSSSHISRCHCEILVNDGQIWVKDLGSHNGTYINSERITRAELHPGDRLGLSRRVTFILAMDQDMQKPEGMEVEMEGEGEKTQVSPQEQAQAPAPPALPPPVPAQAQQPPGSFRVSTTPGPVTPVAPQASAADPGPGSDEPDLPALLKQVEQQRNVLAILYQISLRCLMADDQKEVEQLLTNVLQRLVPLEAGFILYQSGNAWRASICPGSKYRPSNETVKAFYRLATQHQETLVLDSPAQMTEVGVQGGSALVVPLVLGETLNGVVGTLSDQPGVYTSEVVDIMKQLANVSAAALRDR